MRSAPEDERETAVVCAERELERRHYLELIESMLRDGRSEPEIANAVEAARAES